MNMKSFLKDKLSFFIFYLILMIFLLGIIGFVSMDNTYSNVLYGAFVSLFLAVIYLAVEFFKYSSYYKAIDSRLIEDNLDWINNLPRAESSEQRHSQELLLKAYEQAQTNISTLIEKHKDNIDFINTWVHEIKVPVTASKLVIDSNLGTTSKEVLLSIKEEIEKIESYVEQILYYSKINDFSRDYLISQTDMAQLIRETVKRFKKTFIAKGISVSFHNIEFSLDTDRKWVSYILEQLLSNALKYTPERGNISLSMEETTKEYILKVEDNGIGIPKEDIKRVFERGFTGSAGRKVRSSTGLGLYMAQKLGEKLGLWISVQSTIEKGSTFIIHFPKYNDYYIK